ncbi:MAG: metal ABC transporter ATP-binding protein [Bacillota bacterium]|nr:metal ABC transporter ATP-binding protein [Bacillota bacterium]
MSLLKCDNVSMSYDGKTVISGLNFSLNSGEYLCVVGENGSGKSTLMKGILGLMQPTTGKIVFSDDLKQNQIGYLPQQSGIQKDFPASVWEVVLSGCLSSRGLRPFYTKANKETAYKTMERLNILNIRHKCFRELSGGQQQRVLLARALSSSKKLVLLDEPVTGLDPISSKEMYYIINEINKKDKVTVIMVSHDIISAVDHADHILHLCEKDAFFGKTSQYLHSELGSRFLFSNCNCDICKRTNCAKGHRHD